MSQKTFIRVVGVIFAVIALLHGLRLVLGWSAVIGTWHVPVWVSWLALAVSGYLASTAFTMGKKKTE